MKEFINEVLKYRENFVQVKLSYTDTVKIQKSVLKSLNVKSMFELRDKFEGVAFFENFSKKVKGVIAVEKCLGVKLIDWDLINPKTYTPEIVLNNIKYDAITSGNGSLPLIEKINKKPAIIAVSMSEELVFLCGIAPKEVLNKFQNDKLSGGLLSRGERTAFVGFNHLEKIELLKV